jgi:TRAP-type C4-dicarboxylate transport system permease small subunit
MKYINTLLNYLLFLVLVVMSFTMAANVTCRFCFNFSISWADELSQSLMLWLTFLGAAVAFHEHSHYSFNYIELVLKGRLQQIFILVSRIVAMIGVLLLLYWSVEVTEGIARWIMPAMGISRAWIYGACPVGCSFMLLYGITDIITDIKKLKS